MRHTQRCPLQVQRCREYPIGHCEIDNHADQPGNSSTGLWEGHQVRHHVTEAGYDEDSEVQESGVQVWTSQRIQQANQDKRHNILDVIQMASVDTDTEQSQPSRVKQD